MSSTGTQLVKFGALALIVQNAILLLGAFTVPSLLNYVFYIDLIGFLLLGVGYILHAQQGGGEQQYLIGGVAVVVFLLARVMWQFVLTDGLTNTGEGGFGDFDAFFTTLNNMIYAFLFSSIALLVAGYMINKVAESGGTLFFSFGIVNFIAAFLMVQPFITQSPENIDGQILGVTIGFFLKFIAVPILALILFAKVFSNTDSHLGMGTAEA